MGAVIHELAQLRRWTIPGPPAADTTTALWQVGAALVGGAAGGTWIGGTLSGAADIVHFRAAATLLRVSSAGVLQVGGDAPSSGEIAYFRVTGASGAKLIHLDNDTDSFTAADTPVRYQCRAYFAAQRKLGYTGLDRYFDASGIYLLSTDAAGGIGVSGNNSVLHARFRSDGKFVVNSGIGVGNSIAASSLGALSRAAAIYDWAGSLLGYVPIYASAS